MTEILLVNGPNLNLLGVREPEIYGSVTLEDIEKQVTLAAAKQGFSLKTFQSNSEGKIIDFLQENADAEGLIINPGAYTHYSYAIRDCIAGLRIPAVEVHLSQIYSREEFRQRSVIAPVCIGQISGFGDFSYLLGLQALIDYFTRRN
ncbi:MAG: type II 3-dehydroquinate dehydratase [Firmicutes bacterium]|nr:type II 3-dehydroquinate dehydratase [Bacillota bacterium]